jgi:glycosyltransferase involved in cell wall biosynthesis
MADEVISLLRDEERRREIGLAGLNNIRQSFSYQKITNELEAILESIIKEKQNGTKK